MSREKVSTEFDDRRISVIVHRSASDKLAVESFTLLACLGPSLVWGRVSSKVSSQTFVNSCLAHSISVKILNNYWMRLSMIP